MTAELLDTELPGTGHGVPCTVRWRRSGIPCPDVAQVRVLVACHRCDRPDFAAFYCGKHHASLKAGTLFCFCCGAHGLTLVRYL